jgi:hypothetical protein
VAVVAQQRAQNGDGFVKPLPALLEQHADRVVVTLR